MFQRVKEHIRTTGRALAMVLLVLGPVAALSGQSITVAETGNAILLGSDVTVSGGGLSAASAGSTFSIAGVLDVGFLYDTSIGSEERRMDIGLSYAVTPLKQSATVPLSAQIYGHYTYRSMTSDFLDRNKLRKEARGYSVGLLLARDFALLPWLRIRIGGLAEFLRYLESTTLTFTFDPDEFVGEPDVDYREYPLSELQTNLRIGPYAAFLVSTLEGLHIGVSFTTLFDPDGGVQFTPGIQMAYTR